MDMDGHHVQTRINWHIGHSPHDSISFCAVHFVVRVVFPISALANCISLLSILLRPFLVVVDKKKEQRLMLPDILHLHPSPNSALGSSAGPSLFVSTVVVSIVGLLAGDILMAIS